MQINLRVPHCSCDIVNEMEQHVKRLLSIGMASLIVAILEAAPTVAFETVIVNGSCTVEGLARPLRQTLVLIDQAAIEPKPAGDVGEVNRRWINRVLSIAGVQDGQPSTIAAPRERISVVVAMQDGSDLIRAFSGCSPTYSSSEITELQKSTSPIKQQLDRFLGRNIENRIEAERKSFRSKLTGALAELSKMPRSTATGDEGTSFLRSLALLSGRFDLSEGIPRIVLVSPMRLSLLQNVSDEKSARILGFDTAEKLGADLQRAEVYIVGMSPQANRFVREFSQAFFLGSKAKLISASGETMGQTSEVPERIRVFSGFINYGGVQVPMQIRFATDRSGSLVNSWAEVTVKRAVATPLTGKAVCRSEDLESCEVKGDGKEFAQLWAPEIGGDPKFSDTLPFSGVRYFEFTTTRTGLKGRVYDPLVIINGKKELPFELTATPNIKL
jgi:hypothetical protein